MKYITVFAIIVIIIMFLSFGRENFEEVNSPGLWAAILRLFGLGGKDYPSTGLYKNEDGESIYVGEDSVDINGVDEYENVSFKNTKTLIFEGIEYKFVSDSVVDETDVDVVDETDVDVVDETDVDVVDETDVDVVDETDVDVVDETDVDVVDETDVDSPVADESFVLDCASQEDKMRQFYESKGYMAAKTLEIYKNGEKTCSYMAPIKGAGFGNMSLLSNSFNFIFDENAGAYKLDSPEHDDMNVLYGSYEQNVRKVLIQAKGSEDESVSSKIQFYMVPDGKSVDEGYTIDLDFQMRKYQIYDDNHTYILNNNQTTFIIDILPEHHIAINVSEDVKIDVLQYGFVPLNNTGTPIKNLKNSLKKITGVFSGISEGIEIRKSSGIINLSQIEVFDMDGNRVEFKDSEANSVLQNNNSQYGPQKLYDNNTNTFYHSLENDDDKVVRLYFNGMAILGKVIIYNRLQCCKDRAVGIKVYSIKPMRTETQLLAELTDIKDVYDIDTTTSTNPIIYDGNLDWDGLYTFGEENATASLEYVNHPSTGPNGEDITKGAWQLEADFVPNLTSAYKKYPGSGHNKCKGTAWYNDSQWFAVDENCYVGKSNTPAKSNINGYKVRGQDNEEGTGLLGNWWGGKNLNITPYDETNMVEINY